jgi:indole-3-glycerol phosphate synthase
MADFLDMLVRDAKETIKEGYYEVSTQVPTPVISLKKMILESKNAPIITEIKAASPSLGVIRSNFSAEEIAQTMKNSGAIGISVLTEPKHFEGSLSALSKVREAVNLPILMKDIFISPIQLDAAFKLGANVILLIEALFRRRYCEYDVHEMIVKAHSKNLEVLLETHNTDEFQLAINTDADLIGINNRDLGTLKVNLEVTKRILEKNDSHEKIVVSESGIKTPADLRFLHKCGARAFLIGSSIMMAENIKSKVEEFVLAL